jgi:hypothetical protein
MKTSVALNYVAVSRTNTPDINLRLLPLSIKIHKEHWAGSNCVG